MKNKITPAQTSLLEQHQTPGATAWQMDLSDIDEAIQVRAITCDETVARYAEIYRANKHGMTPIVVFEYVDHTGAGTWYVADGCHRVAAARAAGLTEIDAITKTGSRRDAQLFAITDANHDHGLHLTNADKRRLVEILLADEEWRQWSDRELARRVRCSPSFVGEIRKTVHGAQSDVRKSKDGVARQTKNIGKSKTTSTPVAKEPLTRAGWATLTYDLAEKISSLLEYEYGDASSYTFTAIAALCLADRCFVGNDGYLSPAGIYDLIGEPPGLNKKLFEEICIELHESDALEVRNGCYRLVESLADDCFACLGGLPDIGPGAPCDRTAAPADDFAISDDLDREDELIDAQAAEMRNPIQEQAPAEPETLTVDQVTTEPKRTSPEPIPRAKQIQACIAGHLADQLDAGKVGRLTLHQAAALAVVVGCADHDELHFGVDLIQNVSYELAQSVSAELAYCLRQQNSKLKQLPTLRELCALFGHDYDLFEQRAEGQVEAQS